VGGNSEWFYMPSQEHKKKAVNLLNGLTASKSEKGIFHKTVTSLESSVSASL
jgi:hypothetical protein